MSAELISRPVYLRHTATTGQKHVTDHWCWDVDLFLASQQRAVAKVNADALKADPPQPAGAKVEQITPEQFRTERKAKQ
jgi:hypothetical protein